MSKNQYSEELTTYDVKPYKEPKLKLLAYILSFLYLIFVCLPVFLIVYLGVDIAFFIRDSYRLIKKTIKNAKAKSKPVASEILP